jgi:hypothetical protein
VLELSTEGSRQGLTNEGSCGGCPQSRKRRRDAVSKPVCPGVQRGDGREVVPADGVAVGWPGADDADLDREPARFVGDQWSAAVALTCPGGERGWVDSTEFYGAVVVRVVQSAVADWLDHGGRPLKDKLRRR